MRTALFVVLPLLALTSSAAPAQAPGVVEVHLSNFKFTPNQIQFQHGQPYVLRLVNDGGGGHDFTAPAFFAGAAVVSGDRDLISEGAIEVPGHQVREIHFTAPRPGSYKLKCTHSLHSAFGMKGKIVVR